MSQLCCDFGVFGRLVVCLEYTQVTAMTQINYYYNFDIDETMKTPPHADIDDQSVCWLRSCDVHVLRNTNTNGKAIMIHTAPCHPSKRTSLRVNALILRYNYNKQ